MLLTLQASNIRAAAGLVRQHQRDFSPLSTCSDAERDRIEAEVRATTSPDVLAVLCRSNRAFSLGKWQPKLPHSVAGRGLSQSLRGQCGAPGSQRSGSQRRGQRRGQRHSGGAPTRRGARRAGIVETPSHAWPRACWCAARRSMKLCAMARGPARQRVELCTGVAVRWAAAVRTSMIKLSDAQHHVHVCPPLLRAFSQCLILSERLQAIGRAFDQLRSQRAVQLARQQLRRSSRTQPVCICRDHLKMH